MLASMPALIMTTKWKRDGNSGLRVSKLLKGENEQQYRLDSNQARQNGLGRFKARAVAG
jgi:hypothetical protein